VRIIDVTTTTTIIIIIILIIIINVINSSLRVECEMDMTTVSAPLMLLCHASQLRIVKVIDVAETYLKCFHRTLRRVTKYCFTNYRYLQTCGIYSFTRNVAMSNA